MREFPKCPYLINGSKSKVCKILAEQSGGILGPVSPIRCEVTCKLKGPYCGKEFSSEKTSQFVADELLMSRIFWKNGEFMKRVLNKYLSKVNINMPHKEWLEIKTALTPFIEKKLIESIFLTGSLILKINKHKDYDILLKIKSWENFDLIESSLPEYINGVKCDYFFTVDENMLDRFFTVLDYENKTLYQSSWYTLNIESIPDDIIIKTSVPLKINEYIKDKMIDIIARSKAQEIKDDDDLSDTLIESKIGWTYVKNTWDKANSLFMAAKSRGIIPTIKQYAGFETNEGNVVSDDIYNKRKQSCFGNKELNIPKCEVLKTSINGYVMCGACGCGENNIANLEEISGSYSKLMYPYLECPLKKEGFSNHEKTKVSTTPTLKG